MRKLAKKSVGGVAKSTLKKAQVGVQTMSPRMSKAVSDSTAGANYMAQMKSKYSPEELQGSNVKSKMEAAARATKRPSNVRTYEKEKAVLATRSAATEAANKAKYQKEFAGRSTSSAKPAVTVRKTGGSVKSKKK